LKSSLIFNKENIMQTVFQKFGQHSLKGALLPDGRFVPDYWDATRILLSIQGVPSAVLDTMPEVDSPLDAAEAFTAIVNETKNRPETIAFKEWLDGLTRGEKGYTGTDVVDMFRHFGREVTLDEIFQSLLESPDADVVHNGDTTRIYSKDGELLTECHKQ
jgi:hypothetical protein